MVVNTFVDYLISISIAELVLHPVSVIKNNYIKNRSLNIATIIFDNKFSFFYKTSPIIIAKQIICCSSKFSIYEYFKQYQQKYDTIYFPFVNSFCCYGLVSIIDHPFEKIFIDRSTNTVNANISIKNLYKGYSATLSRQLLTSILLPINDLYRSRIDNVIIASISASITTTIIVHPVDNMRIQLIATNKNYRNFSNVYRGLPLSMVRNSCHFTLAMYILSKIKS